MMARAILPTIVWGYAIYKFWPLWQASDDYHFGWFVPALCLALFRERWQNRPAPTTPRQTVSARLLFILAALALGLAALLMEVVPIWRFAGWLMAGSLVSLTLLGLYFSGGRAWVRHLWFPVVFFLVAIPWPSRLETPLMAQLSLVNAMISANLSNLIGIPCLRQGTLLETGNGVVGVEDACSGIRSLQTTLMVALFLGELFRYPKLQRALLLFGGAGLTLAGNVARTAYLIRICDEQGTAGVQQHHDEAGLIVLGITLAGLFLLAWGLRRKPPKAAPPTRESLPPAPSYPAGLWLGLVIWIAVVQAGMEYWFSFPEQALKQAAYWTFSPPRQQAGYAEKPIPAGTRETLKCDEGVDVGWHDEAGRPWEAYYLRWLPTTHRCRAAETMNEARKHAPEVCLKGTGMILQTNWGIRTLDNHGIPLRTSVQRFEDRSRPFYVLAAFWEPRTVTYSDISDNPTGPGFKMAWQAIQQHDRGRLEKRVVKIGVWDMSDDATAIAALERCLASVISPPVPK